MDGLTREEFEELLGFELEDWQWEKINVGDRVDKQIPVKIGDHIVGRVVKTEQTLRGLSVQFTVEDEWAHFVGGNVLTGLSAGFDVGDRTQEESELVKLRDKFQPAKRDELRRWDHKCPANEGLVIIMLDAQYWCGECGTWCPWKKPKLTRCWVPDDTRWEHYCYHRKAYWRLGQQEERCEFPDCGVERPPA